MGGFSLSEDTYGGEYEMPDGTRVYVSSDQPSEASEDMPHAGGIKPNNQPSPAPAGNTQGIIVPQTAPEASGAGNSAPTPEPTEEEEGWWGSWGSALVHGTLDVVGLIPVVGEVADGVNAVLYLAEGKKAEAVISMLAMAPFGGQAATVAKLGMKGAEAAKAAGKATAEAGAKATREGAEAGAEQASKRTTTGKDGGHVDGPKKGGENNNVEVDERRPNINLPSQRPSWRQSEIDLTEKLEQQGFRTQISFKDGVEVPYGTKGSTRPEAYRKGLSVEVKNYNVETSRGRSSLVRNVSKQAQHRAQNLPPSTVQQINIDVRGQNVTRAELNKMTERILEKSNGTLKKSDINIVR